MQKKKKLSQQHKVTKSWEKFLTIKEEITEIDKRLSESLENVRKKKEDEILLNLKDDLGLFYKYANSFSNLRSEIGPLVDTDGQITADPQEMAELLSLQYKSVFSTPRTSFITSPGSEPHPYIEATKNLFGPPSEVQEEDPPGTLTKIIINFSLVSDAIAALSNKASPGPDGIPTTCYKYGGNILVEFLVLLFKESLASGTVPPGLKEALISPIFKGGVRAIPASYRPVALTPHLSKILERVVRTQIVEFLEGSGLLDSSQHRSRPGRSTLSQLLIQYDHVLDLLLQGMNVEILYLDFAKAFDKIDIGILLKKLHDLGLRGDLGRWIASFVLDRRQAVKVGHVASTWMEVVSGIPQGSCLGPLLFLIYIGDLGSDISSAEALVLKYVDDSKVIQGVSTEEDVSDFQDTLGKIYHWQHVNNMMFNDEKFQVLRIGHNQELKNNTSLFTHDYQELIHLEEVMKDLWVIMDVDCSFSAQREKAVAKAKDKAS